MTQSLPSRGLQLLTIPRIHSPFIPFSNTTLGLYLGIWHPAGNYIFQETQQPGVAM